MRLPPIARAIAAAATLLACMPDGSEGVSVVAAVYPLAWAAAAVGGPGVDVTDLTPPGTEAHDTTLTAAQRAELQTADVVVYLGDTGFQPDVERSIHEARGTVIDLSEGLDVDLAADPHIWLDPVAMGQVVEMTRDALVEVDAVHTEVYDERSRAATAELEDLDAAYRIALGECDFTTFIATHEAFGYMAARYGLEQLGIQGLAPESEPTAEQIQAVAEAIADGRAAPAVFYEATEEGTAIAESIAVDADVHTRALGTLEADPGSGDYMTVMRANLEGLREGLRCEAA